MTRRQPSPTVPARHPRILDRHTDRIGRVHWFPTAETGAAEERFARFQRQVLTESLPPAAMVAAHLVAFDGIGDVGDLERALTAAARPYRWRDAVRIDWEEPDGYVDARELSPLTQIAISAAGDLNATPKQQIDALADWLAPDGGGHARLQAQLEDGQAWAFRYLPGFALAHCTRAAPMNLLTRDCLAREATGLAGTNHIVAELARLPLCEAMDAALPDAVLAEPDLSVIETIVACTRLGRNSGGSYDATRRRILARLGETVAAAARAGRIHALICAWLIDMVESGSPRTALYAPNTIANYASAAAIPLALELARLGGLPSDAPGYAALYEAVKSGHTSGRVKDCASALMSFHRFVMRWFDAPPLAIRLHADVPVDVPVAEIVWPHELARAVGWAASAADERLGAQLVVGLSLGGEMRIRTNELLHLRLRNIRLELREIEIYPMRRDGRTKSASGVRIGRIGSESVYVRLRDWMERRRKEGACDEDLLFGSPNSEERVYRAGTFVVALTGVLQAATGDDAVTFHSLSHAFVTNRVAALDAFLSAAEINPLDELAAEAGHFSVATSLRHYAHRIETVIRKAIDRAILASGFLKSHVMAKYSGVAAATLRQRARRAASDAPAAGWAAIEAAARAIKWPAAEFGVALREPVTPTWLGVARSSDFPAAINALIDLNAGLLPEVVALRAARPLEWVEGLAIAAADLMLKLELHPARRCLDPLRPAEACRLIATPAHFYAITMRRARQARFAPLAAKLVAPSESSLRAFGAWVRAYQAGHLSLEEFDVAQQLVGFLASADVPVRHLAICAHASADVQARIPALRGLFRSAYGVPVPVFWRQPERGRPDLYLLWSSSQIKAEVAPPPASCGLDGMHALMLAYGALQHASANTTKMETK